jgi:hypothetical protein
MDRIEKLRELYDSIIEKIEPLQIAMIVLNDIKDIEKFKHNFSAHFAGVAECYNNYLELIQTPESKHIALNRLKSDFKIYGDESRSLFNWQRHSRSERVQTKILNQLVDIDAQSWYEVCRVIEDFFFVLTFEYANEDLARLEFELIGAAATSRKSKPNKEQKLALNQNELMYLFMQLGAKDIFTKTDKFHLARGIESLSGFSANKTREKGVSLKLSELEKIKTILDSISVSLDLDIKQSSE